MLDLPNGWAVIPLKSAVFKASVTNEIKIKQRDYLSYGIFPVIDQGADFIGGYTNDEEKVVACTLPAIVFGDHTKNVKFVNRRFCAGADGIKVMESPAFFHPKCLYYFICLLAKKIPDKGYARHYQHLEKETLPIPPLAEQYRIVAKIDALFSELDKGVETLQIIQQQLRMYRQAVLKWAFESKEWERFTIEKFLTKNRRPMATGPFGTMLKKHEHKQTGVPVLGIENIGQGLFQHGNKIFVTPEKAKELKAFELHTNGVIISRSGTVGELCLVPEHMNGALLSTNLMRVTLDENEILPRSFIYLFLSKGIVIDQVKELCKGSTRDFINQTILKKIIFPLPPLQEQSLIIAEIESRLSICEKLAQIVDENLSKTQALKQSILKKAFSGQLVPQDPNDEPASILLERIKAERKHSTVKAKTKGGRKSG